MVEAGSIFEICLHPPRPPIIKRKVSKRKTDRFIVIYSYGAWEERHPIRGYQRS
jgi:hypothetical protein